MKKVLIGNGGHTREVMAQMGVKLDRFVDDQYVTSDTFPLSSLDPNKHEAIITIADPKDRHDILQRLPKELKFFTFIHPTALILSNTVQIGEGSFIGAYSILTVNIEIGKHSILNRSCQIGHDTVAGDFLTMMPGAVLSGNCNIGSKVYLGTNSAVREKLTITNETTIGLSAGVVCNLLESGIYVGVPATKK